MGDCARCPFALKPVYNTFGSIPISNYDRMRYSLHDNYIEGVVDDFFQSMPQTIFWHDSNGVCHTQYEWLQECLLKYCRKNYPWETPIYMEINLGQVVLVSNNDTYEKNIEEIFKTAIDIAAEVTKDKSPQVSIVFDGLGLVLADNVREAVRKVISILDKARRMG